MSMNDNDIKYIWNTEKELNALWEKIELIDDIDECMKQSIILGGLEVDRDIRIMKENIYQRQVQEFSVTGYVPPYPFED